MVAVMVATPLKHKEPLSTSGPLLVTPVGLEPTTH